MKMPPARTIAHAMWLGLVLGTVWAPQALRAQALAPDTSAALDLPACDTRAPGEDWREQVASSSFPRPCTVYYYPYPQGPRFSSLHVWGDTGWYAVGSGLSALFPLTPWQSRFPYPAYPTRYAVRPRGRAAPALQAHSALGRPSRPAARRQEAPWAAAAQRQTNPQQWKFGDGASVSLANARALAASRSNASAGSRTAPSRSSSPNGRQRVKPTRMARSTHPRYRQRH
ncbi:MAG: hypothetical protein AAGA68_19940 [Pseudomonadota bacterium]